MCPFTLLKEVESRRIDVARSTAKSHVGGGQTRNAAKC